MVTETDEAMSTLVVVVPEVLGLKLPGTAAFPASPTSPVMFANVPEVVTEAAVKLKPDSGVDVVVPQVVLGAPVKPPGRVPVTHHR